MGSIARSRRLEQQLARRSRMAKRTTREASHAKRTRGRDLPHPIEEGCRARISIGAILPPLRRHRQQIRVQIDHRSVDLEYTAACRRRDPLRGDAPRDEHQPAVDQHATVVIEASAFAHRSHRRLLQEPVHLAGRVGHEHAMPRAALGRRRECDALDRFAAELNALRGEVEPHVARCDDQAAFRRGLDRVEVAHDPFEQRRHFEASRHPSISLAIRDRHEDLALGGVGRKPPRIAAGVDDGDRATMKHRLDRRGIGVVPRITAYTPPHALDDGDDRRHRRHARPDATSSGIRHHEQSTAFCRHDLLVQPRIPTDRAQHRPRLTSIGGGEHKIGESLPERGRSVHARRLRLHRSTATARITMCPTIISCT